MWPPCTWTHHHEDGIEREEKDVLIGDLPIMVKSRKCNIFKENMEKEYDLTTSSTTPSS